MPLYWRKIPTDRDVNKAELDHVRPTYDKAAEVYDKASCIQRRRV